MQFKVRRPKIHTVNYETIIECMRNLEDQIHQDLKRGRNVNIVFARKPHSSEYWRIGRVSKEAVKG